MTGSVHRALRDTWSPHSSPLAWPSILLAVFSCPQGTPWSSCLLPPHRPHQGGLVRIPDVPATPGAGHVLMRSAEAARSPLPRLCDLAHRVPPAIFWLQGMETFEQLFRNLGVLPDSSSQQPPGPVRLWSLTIFLNISQNHPLRRSRSGPFLFLLGSLPVLPAGRPGSAGVPLPVAGSSPLDGVGGSGPHCTGLWTLGSRRACVQVWCMSARGTWAHLVQTYPCLYSPAPHRCPRKQSISRL